MQNNPFYILYAFITFIKQTTGEGLHRKEQVTYNLLHVAFSETHNVKSKRFLLLHLVTQSMHLFTYINTFSIKM